MKRRSSKKRPGFLWVTDPWPTLTHASDTSLRLLLEARNLGHESHLCDVKSIRWENGSVVFDAVSVSPDFKTTALGKRKVGDYRQIHYRPDPPVDLDYLYPLQMLILGLPPRGTEIVNPGSILTAHNEKLEAAHLAGLMPPSFVGNHWESLLAFGTEEGRTVLKPLNQAQSKGVELLDWHSTESVRRSRQLLESESRGFTTPVLLQRYLPAIAEGEIRLWFVNGRLLANVRKLPLKGDFRVNIDAGSGLAPVTLGKKERAIAARIGKHLRARKIRLAAVDLIEGYITDFNFTSPGLIVQMETLLGRNLARPIIQALAQKV